MPILEEPLDLEPPPPPPPHVCSHSPTCTRTPTPSHELAPARTCPPGPTPAPRAPHAGLVLSAAGLCRTRPGSLELAPAHSLARVVWTQNHAVARSTCHAQKTRTLPTPCVTLVWPQGSSLPLRMGPFALRPPDRKRSEAWPCPCARAYGLAEALWPQAGSLAASPKPVTALQVTATLSVPSLTHRHLEPHPRGLGAQVRP